MCFSPEASFVAGAALISCSGLTIRLAVQKGARFIPLACFPLFFGIQQLSEGFLWLSIIDAEAGPSVAAALAFLFFAYFFWPFWVPFTAAMIEMKRRRKRTFLIICGIGICLGMFLYLPVVIYPENLEIGLVKNSIFYDNTKMFPTETARNATRLFYALVICIPLVWSSDVGLRSFGYLILISVVGGFFFASHAFTSIWCFLAAGLSAYLLFVLHTRQPEKSQIRPSKS